MKNVQHGIREVASRLLRLIRPTRAKQPTDASVDPTDARCAKARLAPSVRLATPVQAEDKPAASAELDRSVRPVFVLANQHWRWELNDPAGRLDSQPAAVELCEGLGPASASSVSGLSPDGYRMLPAIDELPEGSGRSSTWCGSTG
jgi:hypothetical protein